MVRHISTPLEKILIHFSPYILFSCNNNCEAIAIRLPEVLQNKFLFLPEEERVQERIEGSLRWWIRTPWVRSLFRIFLAIWPPNNLYQGFLLLINWSQKRCPSPTRTFNYTKRKLYWPFDPTPFSHLGVLLPQHFSSRIAVKIPMVG